MRRVTWTDKRGWNHQALVRDNDLDSLAEQGGGISVDPPSIECLNWDDIKRDLHNELLKRNLITWEDVQLQQNGITASINSVLKRRLVLLFKGG